MVVRLLRTMSSRDPHEPHRASSPLELFFDLTFVVAVARASSTLHHLLVGGHGPDGLRAFPLVFFAIWWAWMNFTWFASAYDPDDGVFRLMVFAQMAGVLVFAAGVPRFVEDMDASVAVAGYVIIRLAAVGQWVRAAVQHPAGRPSATRYAVGVALAQIGWVGLVLAPDRWWAPGFLVGVAAELAIPVWAERATPTNWHPAHIGERYGLFTIIVLGESVLSATTAIQVSLDGQGSFAGLVPTIVGGFLIVVALWWLYFDMPTERLLARARDAFAARSALQSFLWGYGHYVVFASAAMVGTVLALAVDQAEGYTSLTDPEAALVLTIPVAAFVLAIWLLHWNYKRPGRFRTTACPTTAALVLASSWSNQPVLLSGLALTGLIAAAALTHPISGPEPAADDSYDADGADEDQPKAPLAPAARRPG